MPSTFTTTVSPNENSVIDVSDYPLWSTTKFEVVDNTLIYPGHDYIENNLRFTLNREPDNDKAATLLKQVSAQDVNKPLVTTLQAEREINTFFRLDSRSVQAQLRASFAELTGQLDDETVFTKLRELRNKW